MWAIKLDMWSVPYKQGNVTTTGDSHLTVRRYFGFRRSKKIQQHILVILWNPTYLSSMLLSLICGDRDL